MLKRSDEQLRPRNGHTLMAQAVCRISGCPKQKELSKEDQEDNAREFVAEMYDGLVHFDVISTTAKGERLDRPELEKIEKVYLSGIYDLVIFDDLSRLIRGGDATRLLGLGVDHGTRSIGISDGIDTADDTWEEDALNASSENVAHNARCSNRIKQKTMNRFKKTGFTAKRPIAGYIVPSDATTFDEWERDERLTSVILEGALKLKEHKNCSAVAEFFTDVGMPRGPHARSKEWNGVAVRAFYRKPILKGMPWRGRMHTVKKHETGRRISVLNPKGPKYYSAPHLAHLPAELFNALNVELQAANAHFRRGKTGVDPRANVPRKRTKFPGQHAVCWYCGRPMVWGGNGMTGNLMCSGARDWRCWNSIGFNGSLAASKIVQQITAGLYQLDGFDRQYAELVQAVAHDSQGGLAERWQALEQAEADLAKKRNNTKDVIFKNGQSDFLTELLQDLSKMDIRLAHDRWALEQLRDKPIEVPAEISVLRQSLESSLEQLSVDSFEASDLLRQLVPEFHVYLVRCCDGGMPLPRARVRIDLTGSIAGAALVPGLTALFSRTATLDLWEPPPRVRIRERCAGLVPAGREHNPPLKRIMSQLEQTTSARIVKEALALDRQMKSLGLATPYQFLAEPPSDYRKFRRHHNVKYRFEPLPGYEPPAIS